MHLVVSGEGKSDIGVGSYIDDTFEPAPMYYLIDKIIEKKLDYSIYDLTKENITFVHKSELIKVCKKIPLFSGKKTVKGLGEFIKNARGLAKITKEKSIEKNDSDVIAILFRDKDGTNSSSSSLWNDKVLSIESTFKTEGINGVAMIPNPKSEAWLICALKQVAYQNCQSLESRSGNDDSPNSLKEELVKILEDKTIEYDDINEMIRNEEIDITQIDMKSFNYFKDSLEKSLQKKA